LLAATRDAWTAYWTSPLASLLIPATDMPALTRLWSLYDERTRCYRAVRRERLVLGSKRQPRRNPLYDAIASFDAEIRQLEDRFGLSPKARLELGVILGDAARSLADLNADLEDDPGEEPDLRAIRAVG
jgi:P27 family predicted phage terminase small subunit